MSDYFNCPNCGAEVPLKAKSCPDCGSDEDTGWSEDTVYDGIDLPEFEEADTPAKEPGSNKLMYYIVVILTIVAFVLFYLL